MSVFGEVCLRSVEEERGTDVPKPLDPYRIMGTLMTVETYPRLVNLTGIFIEATGNDVVLSDGYIFLNMNLEPPRTYALVLSGSKTVAKAGPELGQSIADQM